MRYERFRYYDLLVHTFVVILLISNLVGQKITAVGPFRFSGAMLFFPITYIFGDVFTEVYGYGASRRAIWIGFFAASLLAAMGMITVWLPSAPGWDGQAAFARVFNFVPRIIASSLAAFWCGEFANSFVMAKMKLLTKGRYLWTRTVGSTVAGQAVDTFVVTVLTFGGSLSAGLIANLILSGYLAKVLYEVAATPVTYWIVNSLKRRAGEARRQSDVKYRQVSADALAETRKSEARLRLIIDSIPVPAWSSRPLCRHQSSAPPGFSGDPFTFTSRRGRGDCIHPQAPDPRIDHRGRPQGGPLVGSVGCNTRDADECHSHADYAQQGAPIRIALFDDRIEIENPGLLPFGLTIEDIMQGISKLRNRVIGRVFHELHLIEQWGSGIQRMTAACQEAGLEAPRLEEIGMHFRVTIPSARVRQPHTDETDRHILTLFGDGVARSTAAVAKHIGLSQRATLARLKSLASRGLVVEIGTGPHDPKRQYVIA